MGSGAGSRDVIRTAVCWLAVVEISVRVSFLPIYLDMTPVTSAVFNGQERPLLLLLNGLPILLFWYAARFLPFRAAIMFVMFLVLDVFVYACMGKVRVLLSPVEYSDIFKIVEAVHVRSAAAERMTAADYLLFVNLAVPFLMWRRLKRNPLPFGPRGKESHVRLEKAGLAVFCGAAALFIIASGSILYGYDASSMLNMDYASASTADKNKSNGVRPVPRPGDNEGREIDPANPCLSEKANLEFFAADQFYRLKDFARYGTLFSFLLSAREQYIVDRELKTNAPDEGSVRGAAAYLASTRDEGHFKDAGDKPARPNVIVILEEGMGRAAFDSPVLAGSGRKVAPFMESLRGELVFTDRAFSPVLGWETPQSEFMVLCSALPAGVLDKYGIVYTSHMDHDYVSLPGILRSRGYHTAVFHPYYKNFWQRVKAYERLGFDRYYSGDDFGPGRTAGLGLCDEEFFSQVTAKLRGLPEPYFAFIITLSSHAPFNIPEDMKSGVTSGIPGIDPYARKYFDAINYADRSLKSFWEEAADIRRHSIVVIFGDHQGLVSVEQYKSVGYDTGPEDTALRHQVPLVISAPYLNDRVKPLTGVVADLSDVAPTVLDMLDIPVPQCFVGSSLFGGKPAAMDGVGDVMDERRVCNFTRGNYLDYSAGKPIGRGECEDLLKRADAARVVSADVIWGKRYSYQGRTGRTR